MTPYRSRICVSRQVSHWTDWSDTDIDLILISGTDYYVIAPDLLGHGNARRGSDYSIAALADELQPFFAIGRGDGHPFDITVGHSLGGVVSCALFPLLKSSRSVRVILVDPPLEAGPEPVASTKAFLHSLFESMKAVEDYEKKMSLPTKEDNIFWWLSLRLCDVSTVDSIFDVSVSFFCLLYGYEFMRFVQQKIPWSFSHLLLTAPNKVGVTVLAADPSKEPWVKEEDLKVYPHVSSKTVWGASHLIPIEAPQAIIETALEGTELQN